MEKLSMYIFIEKPAEEDKDKDHGGGGGAEPPGK
jgi:hypothetical protein